MGCQNFFVLKASLCFSVWCHVRFFLHCFYLLVIVTKGAAIKVKQSTFAIVKSAAPRSVNVLGTKGGRRIGPWTLVAHVWILNSRTLPLLSSRGHRSWTGRNRGKLCMHSAEDRHIPREALSRCQDLENCQLSVNKLVTLLGSSHIVKHYEVWRQVF